MLHIQVLNRIQWVGIDGAPNTLSASLHSPFAKDNVALGVNFYHDRIGALSSNGLTVQYAYRLKFKDDKYKLSFGLQGGAEFRNLQSSKLSAGDGIPDNVDPSKFEKSWIPVFGTGIYFYSDRFSLGWGIPQLLPKTMFKDNKWGIQPEFQMFFSGAYQFDVTNQFKLLPITAIRVIQNQKTQAEFNLNGIFYDKVLAGFGIRTDKSIAFMGQYIHSFSGNKKMNIGYSYDMSWRGIRPSNSGSHEILISFGLPKKNTSYIEYKSPRYF